MARTRNNTLPKYVELNPHNHGIGEHREIYRVGPRPEPQEIFPENSLTKNHVAA